MTVVILLLFYVCAALILPKSINATLAVYLNLIFTLIVFLAKIEKINRNCKKNSATSIVKLSIVAAIILLFTNRFYGMAYLFDCMMCTALFIIIFQSTLNTENTSKLVKFIVVLFLLNSFVSYYERANLVNLFATQWQESWENDYHNNGLDFIFRSTALLGHPLNNALTTAVMMLAILVIPLKNHIKYLLWIIGFFALLCFNARGATICSVGFLVLYMMKEAISKHNFKTLMLIVVLSGLGIYLFGIVSTSSLMGRLATDEVMDGSANERFRVWLPFSRMDGMDLLFGFTEEGSKLAFKAVRLVTMENWLAGFIYHMGIPLTISFLFLYYKVYRGVLKSLRRFDMIFLLGGFVILASMNNSLSIGSWPWIWTYCIFYVSAYICTNPQFTIKNSKYFLVKT